jgi:hypothetical protein
MFNYRVTKYNPAFRNEKGWYVKDDWVSYREIGRKFNDEILTLDAYLEIENKYIQAIIQFMKCNDITSFQVTRIQRIFDPADDPNSTEEMINICNNIKNRSFVSGEKIEIICKLILRKYLWCLLRNDKNMEVRFSHDYYMFIVSKSACKKAIINIEKLGLFVEEYKY